SSFPDTSNTRYQSYGAAACHIVKFWPQYVELLDLVRISKENSQFNHMEKTLYAGLQCWRTRLEFCALALNDQAISRPYAHLGPLHDDVKTHLRALIDSLELLLSRESGYILGALWGESWEDQKAVDACLDLYDSLTSEQQGLARDLLRAFFRGALETFQRFTSESAPDGLVAMSTQAERDAAHIPAMNDANEVALGSWRLEARRNAKGSDDIFSDQLMFNRNDTQAFMDAHFTPADHKYTMELARKKDRSGLAKKKRKILVAHARAVARKKKQKAVARA
ncbi:hypothetical protein P692DRAFT_20699717, partial [Suillus brevipes Sb2]